ncbi:MAG: bifunctional 5,10-methylenetetrahydrofolate dehydrogenase/5,10-methenyltetrahydrofolate cyclohydrolase [Gaiellales bacterium]|nr:bifunctional 5,10-methylenetetrahydrofolate dehydrogenase/5,10-methenyltetrahydrofolate cyclohydrolase [Gaiellales bacterium]
MTAQIIDGRRVAEELRRLLRERVGALNAAGGSAGIGTLRVGDDFGARMYRGAVAKTCSGLGLRSRAVDLPSTAGREEVEEALQSLNVDEGVSGILLLRPLPPHLEEASLAERILPHKDIDCLNPANLGRLFGGRRAWPPATPAACLELMERRLAEQGVPAAEGFAGAHVVIVGRSPSVGRPLAAMVLNRHATLTVCHSHSARAGVLVEICREADYLVAAIGVAELIRAEHVKPGATVIDVGINEVVECAGCGRRVPGLVAEPADVTQVCPACGGLLDGSRRVTVGDVAFAEVAEVAGALTPVPGGVGAVTNVMLARNAVAAAEMTR